MRQRSNGLLTVVIVLLTFAALGYLLYSNAQPTEPLRFTVPTEPPVTANPDALAEIMSIGFGDNSTPLPTIEIPTQQFVAPTIPPGQAANQGSNPINPAELGIEEQSLFTLEPVSVGVTPTSIPPTAASSTTNDDAGVEVVAAAPRATTEWQPPPLPVPQSRDPFGRDHYFMARPVDSNANNYGLFYYPYGSDGLQQLSISRIHHGIDFSNPVGTPIRSAGPGTVLFASSPEQESLPGSPSYGQVIVIEHDFGWQGLKIQTLYAHLDRPLVQQGDVVDINEVIGLSGNSGRSSGPHLHFEVRLGSENVDMLTYGDTFNPALWIVPYVGHGTVAGRLVDWRDEFVDDVFITARSLTTGKVYTTSTYTFDGTISQVNSDPLWQENFVLGDVPQGRYEIVANFDNQRLSEIVTVSEGLTTFIELKPIVRNEPVPTASSTPIPTATP